MSRSLLDTRISLKVSRDVNISLHVWLCTLEPRDQTLCQYQRLHMSRQHYELHKVEKLLKKVIEFENLSILQIRINVDLQTDHNKTLSTSETLSANMK